MIEPDHQLKAIVDEFMVPQLKAFSAVVLELRGMVENLLNRVEALTEQQRTIHVHIDSPAPLTIPLQPYSPWPPTTGSPTPYPGTTWSSKEGALEGTNQENK
jgi:hypothetical protein